MSRDPFANWFLRIGGVLALILLASVVTAAAVLVFDLVRYYVTGTSGLSQ